MTRLFEPVPMYSMPVLATPLERLAKSNGIMATVRAIDDSLGPTRDPRSDGEHCEHPIRTPYYPLHSCRPRFPRSRLPTQHRNRNLPSRFDCIGPIAADTRVADPLG